MAKKAKSNTEPEKATRVRLVVYVSPEHAEALRAEAVERMQERGGGRMDASEVVREVLDAWIAKRKR